MTKILFLFIAYIRKLRSIYYTTLFKKMLHSYGLGLGVNNFCSVSRTAKVDIGNKFSSNGLIINGLGGELVISFTPELIVK